MTAGTLLHDISIILSISWTWRLGLGGEDEHTDHTDDPNESEDVGEFFLQGG